jgi:hypothetical protein
MPIDSVSSSSQFQSSHPLLSQSRQDFSGLVNALRSGDMEAAKASLAALKEDVQDIRAKITDAGKTPFFGTRPAEDLEQLETALQSGDLSGAKKAFHTLMQDMRQVRRHQIVLHHVLSNDRPDPDSGPVPMDLEATGGNINVTV